MAIVICSHCRKQTNNKRENCLLCGKKLDKDLVALDEKPILNKNYKVKETKSPPYFSLVIIMLLLSFMNAPAISYLIVGLGGGFILKKMYEEPNVDEK